MSLFGLTAGEKVLGPLEGQDVFHVALHFLVVVLCFPTTLDPLTAGLVSVVAVEATQAFSGTPTLGDLRDLIFRGLGAALGVAVGLPLGQIPVLT